MTLKIFEGYGGSLFVADNGFGEILVAISNRAEAPIITSAREKEAERLLKIIGKMSQQELYDCSRDCKPSCRGNCNPANPPGFSTHERRNDGVAYRWWPRGFRIPRWARGVDVQRDRVAAFCAEARKMGFTVAVTYPGSINESQHVNMRKKPKVSGDLRWQIFPVKEGSRNLRSREVIRLLHALKDSSEGKRYLSSRYGKEGRIGPHVVEAIKRFQSDHHQKADGIVGVHTIRALQAACRRQKARKK